jgi:hypothetical protein
MRSTDGKEQRRQDRRKAVLPVKVRGKDASGNFYEEWAHTLDLTPSGARLAGFRRQLKALEELTVLYHQRKMEFRVIWTKQMEGSTEYHIGLQALTQDREAWGLTLSDFAPAISLAAQ